MPFKKGQSGNPTGRKLGSKNKTERPAKLFARRYSIEALRRLVKEMRTAKDSGDRQAACRAILDRAEGKPALAVTGPDGEALQVPAAVLFNLRVQEGSANRS